MGITILGLILGAVGCRNPLQDDINTLKRGQQSQEERIAALEIWKETVNSNISALQILVNTLKLFVMFKK